LPICSAGHVQYWTPPLKAGTVAGIARDGTACAERVPPAAAGVPKKCATTLSEKPVWKIFGKFKNGDLKNAAGPETRAGYK
jgi:hypothetical protein